MRILFVDDQWHSIAPYFRRVTRDYPVPSHECIHVVTKEAGESIMKGAPPTDILVLDIMMGDNDDAGIQFLTENSPWILLVQIGVVVLTNRRPNEIRERIKALRFHRLTDQGLLSMGPDGRPELVAFPQAQVQVFQKVVEMDPQSLSAKIGELKALLGKV